MLIKPAFGAMRLAHISVAFAGSMWVLPFLSKHHSFPLTTFYQEWGAALLGLCAILLLVTQRCWQQPAIPHIAVLPLGLMLLAWMQFALGRVTYLDQALLFTLYMLWAALLVMLGHRLREELGLPVLATVLAISLLLGAELNALVGVLQHYSVHTFLDAMVAFYPSAAAVGNLGQANQFADYITLGLISLGLLHTRWRLRTWQVVLLAAPLLFVLTLSGSRSPWLYLLCIAAIAFLWQRRDKSNLPLLYYSLLLVLGFGLMHWVVKLPWLAGSYGNVTALQRLHEDSGGSGIRLHLWREAWLIFTQFPLLGAGFGSFRWQHFQLGPVLRNTNITGPYNHAHNLVMQIAAEMGLAGLIILLGTLALWFWQARGAQRSIYHWWGYGLLAVLAIHSLLEYPLWYAYFLGVVAITLGIFDNTTYRIELRRKHPHSHPGGEGAVASPLLGGGLRSGLAGRLSVAAMLLMGLLSLSQLLYIYKFQYLEVAAGAVSADDSYAQRVRIQLIYDHLMEVQGRALLLRPYVEKLLAEADWDHIADKGALNERVMHFSPNSAVVYREAKLLAQAGQPVEARMQMERAIWAHPEGFLVVLEQLRELARIDAAHFANLLEFALQKYEERQREAHAKS